MINLQKGQKVELGLEKVCVGLGWDPSPQAGVGTSGDLILPLHPEEVAVIC